MSRYLTDIWSIKTPVEKCIEPAASRLMEGLVSFVRANLNGKIESPIELALAEAMAVRATTDRTNGGIVFSDEKVRHDHSLVVIPQFQVGKFRVDFLVCEYLWGYDYWFAVECDGHEFHERTKEQAARDKSRDRDIQSEGYPVLRFTGSEIWRDPDNCAGEIFNFSMEEGIRRQRSEDDNA